MISVFAALMAAFITMQGQGAQQTMCKHSVHIHSIWWCPGSHGSGPGYARLK